MVDRIARRRQYDQAIFGAADYRANVGVSAFTMLAFAMISLSLFGVAGLDSRSDTDDFAEGLYDQGYSKQWIRLPRDEFTVSPLEPSPPASPGRCSNERSLPIRSPKTAAARLRNRRAAVQ